MNDKILSRAARNELALAHTNIPGVVLSYDRATQRADVQPSIKGQYRTVAGEIETYPLPRVNDAPVMFPGGENARITWELAEGDEVLLVIVERSMENWKGTGRVPSEPGDVRRFALEDAVVIPSVSSAAAVTSQVRADGLVLSVPAGDTIRLGDVNAPHPVGKGDETVDRLDEILGLLETMAPIGNLGVPVAFSTDAVAMALIAGYRLALADLPSVKVFTE